MKHCYKIMVPALALAATIGAASCGAKKDAASAPSGQIAPRPVIVPPGEPAEDGKSALSDSRVGFMPRAVAYRMSGDYADNVPVTLAADGSLQSYPAPSDINESLRPLPLSGGWWLDRRGVSARSVFTRYTYAGYAALEEAPSPAQLLEAVIPGARVTSVVTLPMTTQEAVADTAAVNATLKRLDTRL